MAILTSQSYLRLPDATWGCLTLPLTTENPHDPSSRCYHLTTRNPCDHGTILSKASKTPKCKHCSGSSTSLTKFASKLFPLPHISPSMPHFSARGTKCWLSGMPLWPIYPSALACAREQDTACWQRSTSCPAQVWTVQVITSILQVISTAKTNPPP